MDDPSKSPAAIAPRRHEGTSVVALGASAGGIAALKTFFQQVHAQTGAAYVVILHLSPDHDSKLAEILQPTTSMPVRQVTSRMDLSADHVYVIAPNTSLRVEAGALVPMDLSRPEQRRAPVDAFFRTLADSHDRDRSASSSPGPARTGRPA